ncbi:hypothetical protein GCM10009814_03200 [Lapillicoccus jejuensis]
MLLVGADLALGEPVAQGVLLVDEPGDVLLDVDVVGHDPILSVRRPAGNGPYDALEAGRNGHCRGY